MSKATRRADAIEADVLSASARSYDGAVADVIRRHAHTLRLVRELEIQEKYDQARMQIRVSGLIDDLAQAIAAAGRDSAALIGAALSGIREVMADDDGEEA